MSIVRVKKDARYFSASNEPFNDKRLSWETRGLMGYLLSKPNNWQVRMDGLEKAGPAGNHKLRRMLAEARQYGYMNRIRLTLPGNKFDWITEVYESPLLNPKPQTSGGFSTSGSSTSGKLPDIVITEGESTDLNLYIEEGAPKIEPLTEDEARQLEYDLAAMNFSKATIPYFSEFFRLTNILPVGKKQLKEWMDACSLLYGAKLLVSDMSAAFDYQEENNFTTKNPGSLMTAMQTIKMRREKPKPQSKPAQPKTNNNQAAAQRVAERIYGNSR